jgi:hypothetical protein
VSKLGDLGEKPKHELQKTLLYNVWHLLKCIVGERNGMHVGQWLGNWFGCGDAGSGIVLLLLFSLVLVLVLDSVFVSVSVWFGI